MRISSSSPLPATASRQCKHGAAARSSKGKLDANFIEGMACVGGCIGGAGCLTHGEKNKAEVDKYGQAGLRKDHHRRSGGIEIKR